MKACALKVGVSLCAAWMSTLCAQPVEFFSPQGEVKGVRQATARFATAMVPFGDPRELDPFDVDCVEKGKGRWADSKNWVYDFDRDLPGGVRCGFTIKSGVAALHGKTLESGQSFTFTTGGPPVLRSLPYEGSRIDENQIFVLGLDAPAKSETIAANVYCVAAGVNEKIGVRLVTGEERKTILDNRKSFAASYLRFLFLDAAEGRTRSITFRLPKTGSDDDKFLRLRDAPDSPLVTLACSRTLPAGIEAKLVWGRGVTSTSGVPTSADQPLAYRVRPAFRASFSCERVNKNARCIPILPLSLSFTAPIAQRDAAKIRLIDGAGKIYKAKVAQSDEGSGIASVSFGPGLPEQTSFRIDLPDELKDDAGRLLSNAASFPLKVGTDENPPLVKFAAEFGILERELPGNATPMLPLTVRNVEPTLTGKVATTGGKSGEGAHATIPGHVARVAPGDEMKIVDWLRRIQVGNKVQHQYDQQARRWNVIRHGHAEPIFQPTAAQTSMPVPHPKGG